MVLLEDLCLFVQCNSYSTVKGFYTTQAILVSKVLYTPAFFYCKTAKLSSDQVTHLRDLVCLWIAVFQIEGYNVFQNEPPPFLNALFLLLIAVFKKCFNKTCGYLGCIILCWRGRHVLHQRDENHLPPKKQSAIRRGWVSWASAAG